MSVQVRFLGALSVATFCGVLTRYGLSLAAQLSLTLTPTSTLFADVYANVLGSFAMALVEAVRPRLRPWYLLSPMSYVFSGGRDERGACWQCGRPVHQRVGIHGLVARAGRRSCLWRWRRDTAAV